MRLFSVISFLAAHRANVLTQGWLWCSSDDNLERMARSKVLQ